MTALPDKLDEIEAGLEGVTPGPWELDGGAEISAWNVNNEIVMRIFDEGGHSAADAAHIARLDPDTVSALIARVRKAEADAAFWEDQSENVIRKWGQAQRRRADAAEADADRLRKERDVFEAVITEGELRALRAAVTTQKDPT